MAQMPRSWDVVYVRFGSEADMTGRICDVRFTSESRHCSARWQCPLCETMPSHPSLQRGLFVTNIAKFSRAFDELALSSCSFFASCSLIAKAVDFSARHLGCFAFGTLAELTGGGSLALDFSFMRIDL